MKNDAWEIVPKLEGKSVIDSRWLCKVNHAVVGNVEKFKARFVARLGVDYEETFALVARNTSTRFVMF